VLQALVRHDILESKSGSHRGYQLARQAGRIDRKGRPLNFSVTGARVHDSPSCESRRDIQITRRVWKHIFDALAAKSRNSLYLIDSTIVKAHRAASGAKGGRKIRRLASAVVGGPRKSMRSSMAKVDH
jgi:DNA-binding IscR family transcriptional regulator